MSAGRLTGTEARNIIVLALATAIVGSAQPIIVAVGSLAAVALAPSAALATSPITVSIIAVALSAAPATRIIYRYGRKRGFIFGASLAMLGGLGAGTAMVLGNFWLLTASMFFVGSAVAFVQQYRFAIADSVASHQQATAISLVLLGGVASGFLGPRLSFVAKDWIGGAEFAGSFLTLIGLGVVGMAILSFSKLATVKPISETTGGRTTARLVRSPEIFVPILTGMLSYGLMTFVMVGAPLAMVMTYGHSTEQATFAIQWHIVAMFLPSLFTGFVVRRIGAHLTIGTGFTLISGAALVNLSGVALLNFDLSLVLIGVGWNFGFIGSTLLLTSSYRPEEAGRAQSLNEPIVFGVQALAAIGSGVVLQTLGWQAINFAVLPAAGLGIVLVIWHGLLRRRQKLART
jgi:predicted MFS family arabinose efflux permease